MEYFISSNFALESIVRKIENLHVGRFEVSMLSSCLQWLILSMENYDVKILFQKLKILKEIRPLKYF